MTARFSVATSNSALERKLAALLVGDSNNAHATAADLRKALGQLEAAVVEAEAEAARAAADALDPTVCPDPSAARNRAEDAALAVGRLKTLLPRLQKRYYALLAAEKQQVWEQNFETLKREHAALVREFAHLYPTCVNHLTDLFGRCADFDRRASKLHQARPAGCALHLPSVELSARKLEAFSRAQPSLLQALQLFDLHSGKQLWPPVQKRDMALFAPVVADVAHSPDWWRPEVRQARNAEAAREAERVARYHAQQNQEREENAKNAAKP